MSLTRYLEVATLSKEKQELVAYVKRRLGFETANRLGDYLLGHSSHYQEGIEGERNSIEVWAHEYFGIDLTLS